MTKHLPFLLLLLVMSCQDNQSVIRENVVLRIDTYQDESGTTKASAMPVLKSESELKKYEMRFDYLLMNISQMHQPEHAEERMKIWNLYPDTTELKKQYMEKFIQDKKLVQYFDEASGPIYNPKMERMNSYAVDELMDVASKFFYCDQVFEDTTVQSHVCIGLNGVKEARWDKDYTLLAAFCYEAIFAAKDSVLDNSYVAEKKEACDVHRINITTLDQYLLDVRLDLFERMKKNELLKKLLLDYYEANKSNLAFLIVT